LLANIDVSIRSDAVLDSLVGTLDSGGHQWRSTITLFNSSRPSVGLMNVEVLHLNIMGVHEIKGFSTHTLIDVCFANKLEVLHKVAVQVGS